MFLHVCNEIWNIDMFCKSCWITCSEKHTVYHVDEINKLKEQVYYFFLSKHESGAVSAAGKYYTENRRHYESP